MPDLTLHDPTNCYACGYDLRGLRESGVCPECGLHVRFTLEQRYSQRAIEQEDEQARQDRLRYEKQMSDFDRQRDDADRINAKMQEQGERFDRILSRWEALQDRFEGVLGAVETRLSKRGS